MSNSRCTFVNGLCPTDLCVLPQGHPWAKRGRHITGTTYGSAGTDYADQLIILRTRPELTHRDSTSSYLAHEDTTDDELVELGEALSRALHKDARAQ